MTTRVRFIQEITVSALGRRFFLNEVEDVDDSVVGFLISNGIAVVDDVDDVGLPEADPTTPDEAPRPRRRTKAVDEAAG